MTWKSYELDRIAQKLVIEAKKADPKSLNQAHKMRMTVAYGLERFWGEHLRLQEKEKTKSAFWKATWDQLCQVMRMVDIELPEDKIDHKNIQEIDEISNKLWRLPVEDQRIAIAILTGLCDSIVWWTQRYK